LDFFLNNKGFKNSSFIKHRFKIDISIHLFIKNNVSSIYHNTLVPLALITFFKNAKIFKKYFFKPKFYEGN
jgi:hypothetical protein